MKSIKLNPHLIGKVLLAALLLSALAGVAGSQIAPKVPLSVVLFYSVLIGLGVVAAVVLATVVFATFNQFILRHGGTDPQWFWYRSEPPGLVQLREQAKALADAERARH